MASWHHGIVSIIVWDLPSDRHAALHLPRCSNDENLCYFCCPFQASPRQMFPALWSISIRVNIQCCWYLVTSSVKLHKLSQASSYPCPPPSFFRASCRFEGHSRYLKRGSVFNRPTLTLPCSWMWCRQGPSYKPSISRFDVQLMRGQKLFVESLNLNDIQSQ